MKLAWCTDIHLDHAHPDYGVLNFFNKCKEMDADAIVLTGDISCGPQLIPHLNRLQNISQKPVYFVCGNHDYYHAGPMHMFRERLTNMNKDNSNITWLGSQDVPVISLTEDTALIGHDGWYDCMHGDVKSTYDKFIMSDWIAIDDYAQLSCVPHHSLGSIKGMVDYNNIIKISQYLAMQGAEHVREAIAKAVKTHNRVIVATHVPPWAEASLYMGEKDTPNIPWYTSKIMGNMLEEAAKTFDDVEFIILAGHTHDHVEVDIIGYNNLKCCVGQAAYRKPKVSKIWEF